MHAWSAGAVAKVCMSVLPRCLVDMVFIVWLELESQCHMQPGSICTI